MGTLGAVAGGNFSGMGTTGLSMARWKVDCFSGRGKSRSAGDAIRAISGASI